MPFAQRHHPCIRVCHRARQCCCLCPRDDISSRIRQIKSYRSWSTIRGRDIASGSRQNQASTGTLQDLVSEPGWFPDASGHLARVQAQAKVSEVMAPAQGVDVVELGFVETSLDQEGTDTIAEKHQDNRDQYPEILATATTSR